MQIDHKLGQRESPAAINPPAKNDSQRWLAELEREFLQANASAPTAPASLAPPSMAPTQTTSGVRAEDSAAPTDASGRTEPGRAGGTAHPEGHALANRPPTGSPLPQYGGVGAIAASAAGWPPASPSLGSSLAAASAKAGAPDQLPYGASTPEPVLPSALAAANVRSMGPRGGAGEAVGGSTGSYAPAPRYARQLMSLIDGENPSASIRDANLSPAEAGNVALNVSLQLHASGFGVRRIFINGQRFECTHSGVALRPDHLQPLIQDDDV